MKCNVGGMERATKIVAGIALLGFGFAAATGLAAILAYVVGGALLFTGLIRFCPITATLGISTCAETK